MKFMNNIIDKGFAAGGQIAGGRDYQEDAFSFCELNKDTHLLILTDGMGGHVGGARASALTISEFERFISGEDVNDTAVALKNALYAANDAIRTDVESNPENKNMGCTLIGATIINGSLSWISVGDSPLWLLRDGEITRLNADHSMRPVLESLVALGRMSEAEFQADNRVNQLRSAVNGEDIPMIDSKTGFSLQQGDKIILASDGVETLSDAEIIRLGTSEAVTEIVSCLLDEIEAINKPSQDNATVVVYLHNESGTSL